MRAVNPRTWITQTDYLELEFRPSLRAFAVQRAALLAVLEALPPDGWSRAATVTGAGKTLELLEMEELGAAEEFVASNELLDPESPDKMFEPVHKRGLAQSWAKGRAMIGRKVASRRRRRG